MDVQEAQTTEHSAPQIKLEMDMDLASLPKLPLSEGAFGHPLNDLDLLDHLRPLINAVMHDHPYCQNERK